MSRFSDWARGPLGVPRLEAERIQKWLEPGEKLRYVFEAETKVNLGRLLLSMALKGGANVTGRIYVVITDRAVLLTDVYQELWGGDRRLFAELPLPSSFGPVSGQGWIVLDGRAMSVVGGRKVIERAEAALRSPPLPS